MEREGVEGMGVEGRKGNGRDGRVLEGKGPWRREDERVGMWCLRGGVRRIKGSECREESARERKSH